MRWILVQIQAPLGLLPLLLLLIGHHFLPGLVALVALEAVSVILEILDILLGAGCRHLGPIHIAGDAFKQSSTKVGASLTFLQQLPLGERIWTFKKLCGLLSQALNSCLVENLLIIS